MKNTKVHVGNDKSLCNYDLELPWSQDYTPTLDEINNFCSGFLTPVSTHLRVGLRNLYGYESGMGKIVYDSK